MHGCPLAPLSGASLTSFDENRLLKIHQKTQFWLYCTSETAEAQEAGKAGVHHRPGSENIPEVTQCSHPSPLWRDAWWPTCALTIFGRWSCSLATPRKNGELQIPTSKLPIENSLSNFQKNHSKTKEKSAFFKKTNVSHMPSRKPPRG